MNLYEIKNPSALFITSSFFHIVGIAFCIGAFFGFVVSVRCVLISFFEHVFERRCVCNRVEFASTQAVEACDTAFGIDRMGFEIDAVAFAFALAGMAVLAFVCLDADAEN